MYDLTIIKQNGGIYVDSREVAEAIGKSHHHLLRDIRSYAKILGKGGLSKVGLSDFFIENSYINTQNKEMPCYFISKMGCELVAKKLIVEKCVLFTAAYVAKFNDMETAEREAEIKAHARPRLGEFNSAIRNVLNGMSYCLAAPRRVMDFLRGAYTPLGIEVLPVGETDYYGYYSVTEIAAELGVYSENSKPHGHAISAIISKLENPAHHALAIPYGLVGVMMRYDRHIVEAVWDWIVDNGFPDKVPYQDFNYHMYYERQLDMSSYDDCDCDDEDFYIDDCDDE